MKALMNPLRILFCATTVLAGPLFAEEDCSEQPAKIFPWDEDREYDYEHLVDPEFEYKLLTVIKVTDMDDDLISQFISHERKDIIVEFSEDTILPINVLFNGNIFTFTAPEGFMPELNVQKTFYVKYKDGFQASLNLKDWSSLGDFISSAISCKIKLQEAQELPVFTIGASIIEEQACGCGCSGND
ncbi:MAG: hypothetical protein H0X51_08510 [Parachlamydiaceae bacterium]|nr:hypothetical protein [Parachlamydiaceae bacterium]